MILPQAREERACQDCSPDHLSMEVLTVEQAMNSHAW